MIIFKKSIVNSINGQIAIITFFYFLKKKDREMDNLNLEQRKEMRKFSENKRNFEESTVAHTRKKIKKNN